MNNSFFLLRLSRLQSEALGVPHNAHVLHHLQDIRVPRAVTPTTRTSPAPSRVLAS